MDHDTPPGKGIHRKASWAAVGSRPDVSSLCADLTTKILLCDDASIIIVPTGSNELEGGRPFCPFTGCPGDVADPELVEGFPRQPEAGFDPLNKYPRFPKPGSCHRVAPACGKTRDQGPVSQGGSGIFLARPFSRGRLPHGDKSGNWRIVHYSLEFYREGEGYAS